MMYIKVMDNYNEEYIRRQIIKQKKRKMRRRRIISSLLAILIVGGLGFGAGKLIGSKAYDIYNKEPISVTADVPIVNVAKEQIGNVGGEPFWSWYGFDERVDWCALFVSWCENELDYIDNDTAPKFAIVDDGIGWFRYRDQWYQPDAEEAPAAGDLIFFDWEQDSVQDHVGIVSAVEGDRVFTIEGNSSDRCRVKSYDKSDAVIYGYGRIVQ